MEEARTFTAPIIGDVVIHGLKHCNVEGDIVHPNSGEGVECRVNSYINSVTVDNSFLCVGFAESEPLENLLFVDEIIGAKYFLIKQYVDRRPQASSTILHPDQRVVVRFPPDLTNIVPPSPRPTRPNDGSDTRSRLNRTPPQGIRDNIIQASDSDGSQNDSERTVIGPVRTSPLRGRARGRGPRSRSDHSIGRGRGSRGIPRAGSYRGSRGDHHAPGNFDSDGFASHISQLVSSVVRRETSVISKSILDELTTHTGRTLNSSRNHSPRTEGLSLAG